MSPRGPRGAPKLMVAPPTVSALLPSMTMVAPAPPTVSLLLPSTTMVAPAPPTVSLLLPPTAMVAPAPPTVSLLLPSTALPPTVAPLGPHSLQLEARVTLAVPPVAFLKSLGEGGSIFLVILTGLNVPLPAPLDWLPLPVAIAIFGTLGLTLTTGILGWTIGTLTWTLTTAAQAVDDSNKDSAHAIL